MPARPTAKHQAEELLKSFEILRIPITQDQLDRTLEEAVDKKQSPLQVLHKLIGELASERDERSTERRIRSAGFRERTTLESFDWTFNAKAVDRVQFEELGTADFVRRKENLILVGQSGLGKSHLIQALGIRACAIGCSVRYFTSSSLLETLTAALADHSLPKLVRRLTRPALVIIDEFGLDRVERTSHNDAASLLYKIVAERYQRGSIALVTNIDFKEWNAYLGDPPLTTALLDRLVDKAIVIKLKGKSYRAARAQSKATDKTST